MLGSCVVQLPLSKNEICSEQTCLLPTLLTWQCALIQALTWLSSASQSASMTIARHAWFSVIRAIHCVLFCNELGSSRYTARFMSDARVIAPSPSSQSFFIFCSIFLISA